ncbi:MAG: ABC transporter substrate-binding protein [Coraliomargaritaceae bacterium]
MIYIIRATLLFILISLVGCFQGKRDTLSIAINAWPGYEFLFLAQERDLFSKAGLEVDLIETTSLQDSLQLFVSNRCDAMACTIIEAVLASDQRQDPPLAVLYCDYSNGADVLLARDGIEDFNALRGKRVGVERASLGLVVLHRSLAEHGLSFDDVQIVFVDQISMADRFGLDLDAVVSYPPVSSGILRDSSVNVLFSSADIPYEILDMVVVSHAYEAANPDVMERLQEVWKKTLDYWKRSPNEANAIMAKRLGLSMDEIKSAYEEMVLIEPIESLDAEARKKLERSADTAESALRKLGLMSHPSQHEKIIRFETSVSF